MSSSSGSPVPKGPDDLVQHNNINDAKSILRRNAVYNQDHIAHDVLATSMFVTELDHDDISVGSHGHPSHGHPHPAHGHGHHKSSPSDKVPPIRQKSKSQQIAVASKEEMRRKAAEMLPEPLPGGLTMNQQDCNKYFGEASKGHFFEQYGAVRKSRDIVNVDPTRSLSAGLMQSLQPSQEADGPFLPSRQSQEEPDFKIVSRVLIRSQSLNHEEGFSQMKLIPKPSYITIEEEGSGSDEEIKSKPVLEIDSTPSTPTRHGHEPSSKPRMQKRGSLRGIPPVKLKSLSQQQLTPSPQKKDKDRRRLPPLHADSVIDSINNMFHTTLNKMNRTEDQKSPAPTAAHVDSFPPAPALTSPPTHHVHSALKGLAAGASFSTVDSGTTISDPHHSPHRAGKVNILTRAASMKKSASLLKQAHSQSSMSNLNKDKDKKKRATVVAGNTELSMADLGQLYSQHVQAQPEAKETKPHGVDDVHSIHKRKSGALELICIEHRDANNQNLIAKHKPGKHKKKGLFQYVPAKEVKDFYESDYEISPKDAYVYNELETDLEIAMWDADCDTSPAKHIRPMHSRQGDELDEQAEGSSPAAKSSKPQLSPRSQYIDSCIRQRLNPRCSLILRKQFTRELNLKHLGMGDEMAVLLAAALVNIPYITMVNLCDNNLTDKGLAPMVHAVVHMHDVTYLNCSYNVIGPCAAAALAHYLSSPGCRLTALILQKADVDDDECRNFVTALAANPSASLLELDLSDNKVGSSENLNTVMPDIVTGGEALADLLRSDQCTLKTLKLGWNLIRLGGAEDLCCSLSGNHSLTDLDLSFNSLGSIAGVALGDALQDNKILKSLRIANNSLDSIACLTICAGILQNQNLEYVNFDGNPIAQQGAKALMLLPTIVGSRVHVSARSCNISLIDANNWFDPGMITRPFELDLSQPFHRAIAIILSYLVPSHQTYIVAHSEYREGNSGAFVNIALQEAVVAEDPQQLLNADSGHGEHSKEVAGLLRIVAATRDLGKAVALFQEVDQDGSGELDEEEFGTLMETLGMDVADGTKVHDVMAEYDVDGGGIIEMHEFLLFLRNESKDAMKRLRELTEHPILINGLAYNLPAPSLTSVQIVSNHTPTVTNNTSMVMMESSYGMTRRSSAAVIKPRYDRYVPPRCGTLKLTIMDGFTQKESYRVISQGDRSNIMSIAAQSGDVLQMTSFGVQNYKIRFVEALGFVQTMSRENTNKISILVTILPHMSSPKDARMLVNKVLDSNKVDINRLKREIGQAYKIIMGQPNGHYCLDMTQEMDRFALNRLLEISMTRAHSRSVRRSALGYGRLGDTSQKGNWSCFRNELSNKKPISISISYASPLPKSGKLEFDFISYQRMESDAFFLNDIRFTNLLVKSFFLPSADRFKALNILKQSKHQCNRCANGDGKTMYEVPKDRALEIGLIQTEFYANLVHRTEEMETYKMKENVKAAWEYDPDVIQLTLANMNEIYTIPTIFTDPEGEAAAAEAAAKKGAIVPKPAEDGSKKLMKAIGKVRMVSMIAKPEKKHQPVVDPVEEYVAESGDAVEALLADAIKAKQAALSPVTKPVTPVAPLPVIEPVPQPVVEPVVEPAPQPVVQPEPVAEEASDTESIAVKLDNNKYFVTAVEKPQEGDMDEDVLSSDEDDSEGDDMDAEYLCDTKAYLSRQPTSAVIPVEQAPVPVVAVNGSGNSIAASGRKSSSLFGSSKRNNSTSSAPPAPAVTYSPSLLRVQPTAEGNPSRPNTPAKVQGIYKNAQAILQQSFYIKSLPPEKKPFSESYNRFVCLLASKNIPAPSKASKTLEILLDLFEYSYLYARHLEMIMIIFEDYGKLKMSDHFGTYRVELFVLLFSNVVDIHNIEIVLRRLTAFEVACITARIGILNLFNPMKPEGSIELDLGRRDDRLVVKMLAQLSVVEPGDNLPFLAFRWEREMDYMPGYELTELWMTEDGLPNKGLWVATYYSGDGVRKRNCKPVTKFRKALLQMVLIDEEDCIPEKLLESEILPPLYGPSVITSNPGVWLGYLAYNEAEYKAHKERKSQQESKSSKGRK